MSLCADIVSNLCQYVSLEDIATCLRLVCRAWRFLRVPMKQLYIPDERNMLLLLSIPTGVREIECDFGFNSSSLLLIRELPPSVETLIFLGSKLRLEDRLIFDSVKQNNVTDLALFDCSQVCDDILEELLGIFCNLTKLDIRGCPITDNGMQKIADKNMLDLKLDWKVVTAKGLTCLQNTPIQILQISYSVWLHDTPGNTTWLGNGFRDLAVLTLENSIIGNELLTCSNLRSLVLKFCEIKLSQLIPFEKCFPRLESLEFDTERSVDPFYYQNCIGIKHLKVNGGSSIPQSLRHVSRLINLETLRLNYLCFGEFEIKYLRFRQLKKLFLNGSRVDYSEFMSNVPIGCSQIEELDISEIRFRGEQIISIIESFPLLRVLRINEEYNSREIMLCAERQRVKLLCSFYET